MNENKEMTNVEKLDIKIKELKERGIKWNVSNYSQWMDEEPETDPEKIAASYLSVFESMDDPDAWTLRSFTDEDGLDTFEIKCKGKDCGTQFKVNTEEEGYSGLICPDCGHSNAF